MDVPTVAVSGIPDPVPEGLHVLDVREDDEWAFGHVADAQHIPLMELPRRLGELPESQILVVCKVGARSAQAAAYLVGNGFDAVNLHGGLVEWEAAGRPMVSETSLPPQVV
jgi:rhodanese-related sulfurtransferase